MKTAPLLLKLQRPPVERKFITVVQGGGDAAKTSTLLQSITIDLIRNPGWVATVTDTTVPKIVGGALRTFQRYVLPSFKNYIANYNATRRVYTLHNRAQLELLSFQDEDSAIGSERDILFMNECNAQPYAKFWQLQRKTRRYVYLDYNPTFRFWAHNLLVPGTPEYEEFLGRVQFYRVDHRHNPFLTAQEHANYENIKDPDLFKVYARGYTGKIKGLVFGHYKELPTWGTRADYQRVFWGIDYGYTNDPTAIVKIGATGRKRVSKECAYQTGLSAESIRTIFLLNDLQPTDVIYSEADPNMVNQLRLLGLPVLPAIKGPGSLMAGIAKTHEYENYITADSHNFIKERNTYKWLTAQDVITGKEVTTNVPVDAWNHLCDADRMAKYTDSYRNR